MIYFTSSFLLHISSIVALTVTAAENCISGSGDQNVLPEIDVGGTIYRVSNIKLTQGQAASKCQEYGMELVNIPTKRRNDMVTSLVQQWNFDGSYWLSARKQPNKKWIWGDLQPMRYTNWASRKPSDSDVDNCVHIFEDGTWNDIHCDTKFHFICERANPEASYNCPSQTVINIYANNNLAATDTTGKSSCAVHMPQERK